MTLREGLLNARSSLLFLAALAFSLVAVFTIENWNPAAQTAASLWPDTSLEIPSPGHRELSEKEMEWARIAWRYFENNTQPATGLANSADKYPASTMWDTGSHLMALIAAQRLELIGQKQFDQQMAKALRSLATLPLFDGALPNKSYNVITLKMVDYNNNESPRGIGWSAIDIGRLFVPFNILVWHYPQHADAVKAVIRSWKLARAMDKGQLFGTALDPEGNIITVQEGRLGYEQYSAKSFALVGGDVTVALNYNNFLRYIPIYDIDIPTDRRRPEEYHAHNYVVSEPYILDGIEYGWDTTSREFAYRVYKAQEERYRKTQVLTAVSEDNLDRAPYFVYNTVFTNGKAWNAITEKGEDAAQLKTLSTKAAFGWNFLYDTPYTNQLMARASTLNDPARGWYAGAYESLNETNKALTANTNAIILESLCFKKFGRLVDVTGKD